MMETVERFVNKAIIIGDEQKTIIRRKFLGDNFSQDHLGTIGADFAVRVQTRPTVHLELHCWELDHNFGPLAKRFYSGADHIIYVFDHATEIDDASILMIDDFRRNNDSFPPNVVVLGVNGSLGKLREVIKLKKLLADHLQIDISEIQYWPVDIDTGDNMRECLNHLYDNFSFSE